jgi:protoporphyrinogen oxidase
MKMNVVIVGSGIAALKTYTTAYNRKNIDTLIVDINPIGGLLASIGLIYKYPIAPIFIDQDAVTLFHNCNFTCHPIEVHILKEGNILDKVKGFAPFDVQRLWLYELAKKKIACFSLQLYECILKMLNLNAGTIRRVHDSIRKIDVVNQIVTTSQGFILKYENLIYTWPLDLLIKTITNTKSSSMLTLLNSVTARLKYVSIYIRSYIIYERIPEEKEQKLKLYFHGTRASRVHTIIKIPMGKYKALLYALTSYSEYYPLLPGIGDKIHSELRKHRIITSSTQVLDYNDVNVVYGFLNILPREVLKEVCEELRKHNIVLFGRVAEWKEYDVPSLLFKGLPQNTI